jgi:hypothetical protein
VNLLLALFAADPDCTPSLTERGHERLTIRRDRNADFFSGPKGDLLGLPVWKALSPEV